MLGLLHLQHAMGGIDAQHGVHVRRHQQPPTAAEVQHAKFRVQGRVFTNGIKRLPRQLHPPRLLIHVAAAELKSR